MQIRFSTVPVVGALLTVLAVLALSVAPAWGQAEGDDVQYNGICQNLIGSIADIDVGNDATATSTADADASSNASASADLEATATADSVAEIAQESGLTIEQVNECLNGTDAATTEDTDTTDANTEDEDDPDVNAATSEDKVLAATIPDDKVLPNTGGFPILAGAGLMLVAAIAVGTRVIGRR